MITEEIRKGLIDFEADISDSFTIKGFHEVLISVRDIRQASGFYQQISGWDEVATYDTGVDQLAMWGVDSAASAQEALLVSSGVTSGHTRLIQFHDVDQQPIRANSQSWDTGGIYDLDVRSSDLDASYSTLQAAGWSGFSRPLRYEFGKFHVSEILMKGPDDVVLAIIQRHQPPLEGFPHMKKLSHVFNSSQVVKDMKVAKDFYINKLGFKIYVEHILQGSEQDENLFGMPSNLYDKITRHICILHPEGINAGSIELIHFEGAEGQDFSATAQPPHLGIMGLRFPIKGLTHLRERMIREDVTIVSDMAAVMIEPYGKCNCLIIKSPDGAWLEFVELENIE